MHKLLDLLTLIVMLSPLLLSSDSGTNLAPINLLTSSSPRRNTSQENSTFTQLLNFENHLTPATSDSGITSISIPTSSDQEPSDIGLSTARRMVPSQRRVPLTLEPQLLGPLRRRLFPRPVAPPSSSSSSGEDSTK